MSQIRVTKQRRTASAGRRGQVEPLLPLDPRDPGITRAKQLQRQPRRPARTRQSGYDSRTASAATSP